MKKLLTVIGILGISLSYAQTDQERALIQKKTNNALRIQLEEKLQKSKLEYQQKLAKYLSECNSVDCPIPDRFIDDMPIFYKNNNQGSSKTIRANSMYPGGSLGLNVTGTDMTAGVWDGGKVRNTHVELTGKITLGDNASTIANHATHVTGTICAAGVSGLARGIAYGAKAKTYDWTNDTTEMTTFGGAGFLVSNHSYGYDVSSMPAWRFGAYDNSSIEYDDLSNVFPYYQIVQAAGNDRNDASINQSTAKGGYDLLTGTALSKNVITVAAVEEVVNYTNPTSVVMSSFSNWGPTDDGRIKPDISAKGVHVYSSTGSSNNSYDYYDGTSMATPAITGLITLLQKHYNNKFSPEYMKASMVRGLLCHTAREAGDNPGPDYAFGWGLADGMSAAILINQAGTNSILEIQTLDEGSQYNRSFYSETNQNIKVSICWTDPSGTITTTNDNRSARLKNNLDLKVYKDGQVYYPWKLDPENYTDPATNISDNNVDNIEVIDIPNAGPGIYTIEVKHKGTLTNGFQDFALIASGSANNGLNLNTSHLQLDKTFFVFPNPTQGRLQYQTSLDVTWEQIEIFDLSGKVVLRTQPNLEGSLDVSALESGAYFIQFKNQEQQLTRKFVKE